MIELVGRAAEQAELGAFLDDIESGPAALVLEGEAGIGKTTLFRAGVAAAKARGVHVLVGRPIESEAQLAYAALGDLLDGVPDDLLADLPPPQRHTLEVALLLAEPEDEPLAPRAVALGVLGVLRAMSEHQTVIIAIDDVQWLDGASRTAVEFVARRLIDERVGFLVSRRHGPDVSLFPADRVRRVHIDALDVSQLDELLRERMGAPLPRHVVARLHRASGGNPFYAIEIARATAADGGASSDPVIPINLQELVSDRLTSLPPLACAAMELTAALSRPTLDVIAAAMPDGEAGVDAAVAAGALEVDGTRVRFAHPLLKSVAYARIPDDRRCELHTRLAAVLHDPEERGRHLALSTNRPDREVAHSLDEAARRARSRGAPDAAADLLEEARRLTPEGDEADAHRRGLDAASHHLEAGRLPRAEALLVDVVDAARTPDERAGALARRGWVQAHALGLHTAEASFRAAQAERPDDVAVRIEIEQGLAWSVHSTGSADDALLHARTALDLAEGFGDPSLIASALSYWALLDSLAGHGIAIEAAARASALGSSPSWSEILGRADWVHALLLQWCGNLPEAQTRFAEQFDQALANGDESSLPAILFQRARVALLSGEWSAAADLARECHDATLRSGHVGERPYSLTMLALVDAHRGRVEEARLAVEEAIRLADELGVQPAGFEARAALGFLDLSTGANTDAATGLTELRNDAERAGFLEPATLRYQGDLVDTLVAVGSLGDAAAAVATLDRLASRPGRSTLVALAARGRGLLLAANGSLAEAQDALQAALSAGADGPPFEQARTLLALGIVQRRDKQKRAARESLADAAAEFARLGAPLWLAKAEAELERVGGRSDDDALTVTERRVAELIASGLSYREAAAELFISPKTVQWNLSKVYRKLGIKSRAELPARLAEDRAL